jgi:phospholipid-translocating ATPase
MWANTVVASGTALGIVIYSGPSCRAVMGNKKGQSKSGIIDKEVNFLTFVSVFFLLFVILLNTSKF